MNAPTTERWRTVTIHAGYEVSDTGGVRNAKTGYALRPWRHKSGHLYVSLGRGVHAQVHRLVLLAFVGPPPTPRHECLHIDGTQDNNRIENLRWGTRLENVADTVAAGKNPHGSRHPCAVLTEATVMEICSRVDSGERYRYIATAYGVSEPTISNIAQGQTWR